MNPYVIIAALIVLGGSTGFAAWKGYQTGVEHEKAAQMRLEDAVEAMQRTAAKAIAEIQVRHTTIQQKMETQIREHEIYRDCRHSADALGLLNDALTDRSAADPAGAGELPAADAAHR